MQATVQVLHALYDRSHFDDNEYSILIAPMYQAENVSLLRTLYEWSIVGVENMHSPKYAISKKFSEVSITRPNTFYTPYLQPIVKDVCLGLIRLASTVIPIVN